MNLGGLTVPNESYDRQELHRALPVLKAVLSKKRNEKYFYFIGRKIVATDIWTTVEFSPAVGEVEEPCFYPIRLLTAEAAFKGAFDPIPSDDDDDSGFRIEREYLEEVVRPQTTPEASFDLRLADVNRVAFAMSKEKTRRFLNAVRIKDGQCVATDGLRLIRSGVHDPAVDVGIPTLAVNILLKTKAETATVEVFEDDTRITAGRFIIWCPRMKEEYPDWKKLIPNPDYFRLSVGLDVRELTKAVKLANAAADKNNHRIALCFGRERLTINNLTVNYADGKVVEEEMRIGVNARYLLESLKHYTGCVYFHGIEALRPMMLTEQPDHVADFTQPADLIMPMRLDV